MASGTAKIFGQKLPAFTVRGVLLAILILWIIFWADWLVPFLAFDRHGIYPRTFVGLWGIVTAPAVHANLLHLLANSFALAGLLLLVGWEARARAWLVIADLWLLSGVGTWLIGRGEASHIGASGVIYGLITYLIAAGLWAGHWRSLLIGLLVLFFYGGALWGVLPSDPNTSWEAHLCGALSGVLVAWLTYERRKDKVG
jgi:membrane associated rhomboid family serine protease